MANPNEFIAGTPIQVNMTFTNEISGALQDPSVVTGAIGLGVQTPVTFSLSNMVQVSTGVWYYVFNTTGVTPGFYTVQVQSSSGLTGISNPVVFTILAPTMSGLT